MDIKGDAGSEIGAEALDRTQGAPLWGGRQQRRSKSLERALSDASPRIDEERWAFRPGAIAYIHKGDQALRHEATKMRDSGSG